ncbi:MAG: glycoside hydrolase family 9 protein, partial [Chitinispirillaceae bacterium]|nr:glycoside hydrolase family 9 protein [Chitinispirillaceae bacterium]
MFHRMLNLIARLTRRRNNSRLRRFLLTFAVLTPVLHQTAFPASQEQIRLNQLGFFTFGPKVAVAISPETWYFTIKSPDLATTYYTGELSPLAKWSRSGEEVKSADFSDFTRKGTYVVHITGIGASYPFVIDDDICTDVSRGLLRAFFFQRCSAALPAEHANSWKRLAGHPDQSVVIHESAGSDPSKPGARRTGETYPSPKGWYDAGDYGKYVVNAGISTYQLLLLYEQFPEYFGSISLNIPESGNALPDILDEIKWEMDWLLTMQDPADGGVYHKVTSKSFCGDLMPAADTDTRYFIGKGSAATFDFAATGAVAGRIYEKWLPGFADTCLDAARKAYAWGMAYPDSTFSNPADVVTGEYGDRGLHDERAWAGYELFCATGDSAFLADARSASAGYQYQVPEWPKVGLLGYYSMALLHNDSTATGRIVSLADGLFDRTGKTPYHTTLGNEFYWGSNGVIANQGMGLLVAFLLTNNSSYLEGAVHALDYLLGRNATGYSFVTGFGKRSPVHPHHRPSTADGIPAPVPGFLVGGPNASAGDDCEGSYPSPAAKSWRDEACSYSTNEIAINWNAPAAFLAGGINAVFSSGRFDLSGLEEKYGRDRTPPREAECFLTGVSSQQVTFTSITAEPTVKTVCYGTAFDSILTNRKHLPRSDTGVINLSRLLPSTVYYFQCIAIDDHANSSVTAIDSFRTDKSPLPLEAAINHTGAPYRIGSPLSVSFDDTVAISATLVYSTGGSATTVSVPFSESDGRFTADIPANDVTEKGLTYSLVLSDTSGTFHTPLWSIAPDSLPLTVPQLNFAKTHTMISLPGLYPPTAAIPLFTSRFGDTAQWCFFGYDPAQSAYLPYDTLRPGSGGW